MTVRESDHSLPGTKFRNAWRLLQALTVLTCGAFTFPFTFTIHKEISASPLIYLLYARYMTSIVEKNVTSLARNLTTLRHSVACWRAHDVNTGGGSSGGRGKHETRAGGGGRGGVISNVEQISCSFTFNDDRMVILPTFRLHD